MEGKGKRCFLWMAGACCALLPIAAGEAFGMEVELELQRSENLQEWETLTISPDWLTPEGTVRLPASEDAAFFRLQIKTAAPDPSEFVEVSGGTLATESELGFLDIEAFAIGRHEVTWGKWKEVREWAAANGYDIGNAGDGCADDHPVHTVHWYHVVKWCNARSEMDGLTPVYHVDGNVYRTGEFGPSGSLAVEWNPAADGYRLPTETEWEFAARGGTKSQGFLYSGSDDVDAVAWYFENSAGAECDLDPNDDGGHRRGTWPVGQKQANELGIHDMSGNVREWCWDPAGDSFRYNRPGGWRHPASHCEIGGRSVSVPDYLSRSFGFRLVRNAGEA